MYFFHDTNVYFEVLNFQQNMPRKYKQKPGTRKYKTCDEVKLQEALERIARGESRQSVCKDLNIVRSSLKNKLQEKHFLNS